MDDRFAGNATLLDSPVLQKEEGAGPGEPGVGPVEAWGEAAIHFPFLEQRVHPHSRDRHRSFLQEMLGL